MEGCSNFCTGIWTKATRLKKISDDVMETPLRRCLTTLDLTLFGIGHMVGAGIYVLTGAVILKTAGPSTMLSYLLGGMAALLSGLCYAEFSVNVPKTGTAYNYIYIIAGEIWAFLAGWNLILEYLIGTSAVAKALSAYINALSGGAIVNATVSAVGEVNSPFFSQIDFVAMAAVILVFFTVAFGAKASITLNNFITVINLLLITAIIFTGVIEGNPRNFYDEEGGFFPYGISGTLAGAGVLFYAYIGFDSIAVAAEETFNPSKSLPIAMCVAIATVTLLYTATSMSLSFLVPYYAIDPLAPFPSAFAAAGVRWAEYLTSIGAVIAISCSLGGAAFCLPRSIYALAQDGLLFEPFSYVHQWTKTPLVAILVSGLVSGVMALIFDMSMLVNMVSIGTLAAVTMISACILKLHYLPAQKCPFELRLSVDIVSDYASRFNIEEDTISLQSSARIGKPRKCVEGFLPGFNPETVTSVAIVTLCGSIFLSSADICYALPALKRAEWWALVLISIGIVTFVLSFVVLLLHEHNISFTKFQVRVLYVHA